MPEENNTSFEASPSGLKFSGKRTAEFVAILSLSLLGVLGYAFWEHKTDSKEVGNQMVIAIREMTKTHMESIKEQRVMNCLLSLEQKERLTRLSECERISR